MLWLKWMQCLPLVALEMMLTATSVLWHLHLTQCLLSLLHLPPVVQEVTTKAKPVLWLLHLMP